MHWLIAIRTLLVPFAVTAAICLALFLPAPFDFWLALGVLLVGPGWSIPRLLFPSGIQTLPEKFLIIILTSLFIETVAFAILNALYVPLTIWSISLVILAANCGTTLAAFLWGPKQQIQSPHPQDEPAWSWFAGGVILVILVAGIISYFF